MALSVFNFHSSYVSMSQWWMLMDSESHSPTPSMKSSIAPCSYYSTFCHLTFKLLVKNGLIIWCLSWWPESVGRWILLQFYLKPLQYWESSPAPLLHPAKSPAHKIILGAVSPTMRLTMVCWEMSSCVRLQVSELLDFLHWSGEHKKRGAIGPPYFLVY